jgi:hypothetical protein
MSESTVVEDCRGETSQRRSAAERERRRAVRGELMWRIEERGLGAALELVNRDAPPVFGGKGVAAAQITCQAALVLGGIWHERRTIRPSEVATFRVLGDLAVRAQLSEDDAIGALEAASEALVRMVHGDSHGAWTERSRAAVVGELEGEAEAFTDIAGRELRLGMAGETQFSSDRAGVVLRALDGRLTGDELGAAAAAVDLDASREHGLVVLVHATGRTSALEAAARDIEDRIPHAIDLGLADGLPIHRRLVFPVVTHGRWVEAREDLHDIASRHKVLAIAPEAAPTLAGLAETYRETERHLDRLVAECGYSTGIIDPACVVARVAAETAEALKVYGVTSAEPALAPVA